jgi:hypothetical protein
VCRASWSPSGSRFAASHAGVNAKALGTYQGHANIAITFDRYGHLMPGSEAEARDRLNAYLRGDG